MKQVGVVDIAREAGVSTATVSRVLNGSDLVTGATREHVLEVVSRLGYTPNAFASSLRKGRNDAIGIAVASISQPWHVKLIRELRRVIRAQGFTTIVYDLEHSESVLIEHTESARRLRLAGMVLATGDRLDGTEVRAALDRMVETVPLVVIGQELPDAEWTTVSFDDVSASEHAILELLERRPKPVLFLGEAASSYLSEERRIGVERALSRFPELQAASEMVALDAGMSYSVGYHEVHSRSATLSRFGTVFCVNDELALGACRALSELGILVPRDMMVIGYGDVDMLPYLTPSLSSLSGDVGAVAERVVRAILARIEGDPVVNGPQLQRQIVHRESTGG
ncbi:LacI family transcriptional regulator [Leucobacter luti]|uniref:LacI family transcriptional regulator n=1 Tax=Leucobacter luti TaxID=340320 RepID=A0A4R6S658_9MICO|nr:LacI family DNA-binding transcriptional regulator [Leucobacter luti]TDP94245.1 LacI family transcriptional regulator [Leucobacter luti]